MRIKNYTDHDINKLREMIRFCKPNGVKNFDITFKKTKHSCICGRAYWMGCDYHSSSAPLIVIRIGEMEEKLERLIKKDVRCADGSPINWAGPGYKHLLFPRKVDCNYGKNRGYLPFVTLDKDEYLVQVVAHELRHLWQAKVKKGHRVWGARGRFSERDADAYGIRKMREWRKKTRETKL